MLRLSWNEMLRPLYSSSHLQNYFGIVLYLFLAMALCGILATVAYLFSLSAVQDAEKRSEYECGFEPFDSATRLPFDVHFYLVGILFLIFDVEIALLFPWVLGLKTFGWFGFYLMLGFIVLLAIGFLYEWKRGALIWPSRQTEQLYVAAYGLVAANNSSSLVSPFFEYQNLVSYASSALDSPVVWVLAALAFPAVVAKTAYVNAPLTALDETIRKTFKIASALIKKTNLKLSAWRFKTLADHVGAVKFMEQRLELHKKSITSCLKKVAVVAGHARNKHFHDEKDIQNFEKRSVEASAIAAKDYAALVDKHKLLCEKLTAYRNKKGLSQKKVKIATALFSYAEAKSNLRLRETVQTKNRVEKAEKRLLKMIGTKRKKLSKKQSMKLERKAGFFGNLTSRRPENKNKRSWKSAAKKISLLLPFQLTTPVDSYATQFFGDFLPEMTITLMLAAILTFMAIELGQGRSKKELALESLYALRTGLSFIIGLYLVQILFGSAIALFNGYLIVTTYTTAVKLLTVFAGRFILSSSEQYIQEHPRHLLEYPVVMTLAILFMVLLVGSGHLVAAFLALVGFSLNLYVLVLFDATTAVAREAGIKYFYLSTVSSGLILYSVFLIFIVVETGHIYEIGHFLSVQGELINTSKDLLQLALTMLFVGLFFKLSAFPGHLWAAEVYEGSPDPITAFFMLPVKVAVLGFVIQLIVAAFEPIAALWQPLLALSAAASLVWGCLAALAELKTKRFLAYASINQIGFLLVGLSSGSAEGYRTTMFYLVLYALMNIGFLIVFLHARRADGQSLIYLTDFRGFGQRYTQHSWSLAMILLSMAGIPPLAGFFGKYYLLLHAQEQQLYGLVIIGLATSLVSTYYYLRLIKIMWFEGRDGMTPVVCELNWTQILTLRLSEWTLWVFIVHSGAITYVLTELLESITVLNNFYVK